MLIVLAPESNAVCSIVVQFWVPVQLTSNPTAPESWRMSRGRQPYMIRIVNLWWVVDGGEWGVKVSE